MTVTLEDRLRPASDVLVREVGEGIVLLRLGSEEYFGLEGTAAAMWSGVAAGKELGVVCDDLAGGYDAPADTIREDLFRFVGELLDAGLVERA